MVCARVRTAKLVPPPTKTTAKTGTIDLPWRQSTRPGCPRALHRQVSRLCFYDAGVCDDMVLDWIHSETNLFCVPTVPLSANHDRYGGVVAE